MLCIGCSTLVPIAGGAAGAAGGAVVGGPAGAATGAALGVATAQAVFPDEQINNSQVGLPTPGTTASTIHEAKGLVNGLGWWYLILFVFVPFLSKRGREWLKQKVLPKK